MMDEQTAPKGSRKRAIVTGLVLILIVLLGQLLTMINRHQSSSLQQRGADWARLRCLDHGRSWVASDKTDSKEGSCH